MGRLELCSPLLLLYYIRENMRRSPEKILSRCTDAKGKSYLNAKVEYDSKIKRYKRGRSDYSVSHGFGDKFMTKDEYLGYREERSVNFYNAYVRLLEIPTTFEVDETKEITAWLDKLPRTRSGVWLDASVLGNGYSRCTELKSWRSTAAYRS